ncbi:MAG: hypothetical protein RL410_513 [Actinomycetota bacterium]
MKIIDLTFLKYNGERFFLLWALLQRLVNRKDSKDFCACCDEPAIYDIFCPQHYGEWNTEPFSWFCDSCSKKVENSASCFTCGKQISECKSCKEIAVTNQICLAHWPWRCEYCSLENLGFFENICHNCNGIKLCSGDCQSPATHGQWCKVHSLEIRKWFCDSCLEWNFVSVPSDKCKTCGKHNHSCRQDNCYRRRLGEYSFCYEHWLETADWTCPNCETPIWGEDDCEDCGAKFDE